MKATFDLAKPQSQLKFPKQEEDILQFWRKVDAFKTQLEKTKDFPQFTFYDGPPFATGKPHYGHILAGTIKDVVTRYASMTGHHVPRRFGWDCHGVPVEHIIDKKLGIKGREDVMKIGIKQYNAECRSIVMQCAGDWERIVERCGRWIDFKNDYKTLDINFMESVWWCFDQMRQKGLVYRGEKVMPFSTGLNTPLSNFEAKLNYKNVEDPSCVVTFPLVDDPNVALCAWTTTPWTLPSNMACCVNPEFEYVKVKTADGKLLIFGNNDTFAKTIYGKAANMKGKWKKSGGQKFEVVETIKGADLVGLQYTPLFDYFEDQREQVGAFTVIGGSWVTEGAGTGIVHCAPGFGEDDYAECKRAGIVQKDLPIVCPVDHNGCYTEEVRDFAGKYVKECDKPIKKLLKEQGRLLREDPYKHEYPFCWRSDTPLLYMTVPSWYIDVPKIRDQLLANNEKTYWVPDFVKTKRFHNWLEGAREWAVSRNRYWGTPIPIWVNEDNEDDWMTIGSVAQLEELTGTKITDLHRESIDDLTFPSPNGGGTMRRVEEVFDCWFESGAMPYGQAHYPFAWKGREEEFMKSFPGDFIAEGLDQTRGWFYTLMVIATALFDKPAFKNLICNGLVLAENGKKMSKSKKNYPDPTIILDKYGADAVRLYLINSPVVRAEPLCFKESGVKDVIKDVFLPWYNTYRFFLENATRFEQDTGRKFTPAGAAELRGLVKDTMDIWVLSRLQSVIKGVRAEMEAYKLYAVVPNLMQFIDDLTKWYVRLQRETLRGQRSDAEADVSLKTLHYVLQTLNVLMAPVTPFLTESFYQNLRQADGSAEESVHYNQIPAVLEELINLDVERQVGRLQHVIDLGRVSRDKCKYNNKQALRKIMVVNQDKEYLDDVSGLTEYMMSELNVKEVDFSSEVSDFISLSAEPDNRALGKAFRKDAKKLRTAIAALSPAEVQQLQTDGKMTLKGLEVTTDHVKINCNFAGDAEKWSAAGPEKGVLVAADLELDAQLVSEGHAREFVNRIQKLRKKAQLDPTDAITVFYSVPKEAGELTNVIKTNTAYIRNTVRQSLVAGEAPSHARILARQAMTSTDAQGFTSVAGSDYAVTLTRPFVWFNRGSLDRYPKTELQEAIQIYVYSQDFADLRERYPSGATLKFFVDDEPVELVAGKDFVYSYDELK